jgi:hypothetical protein
MVIGRFLNGTNYFKQLILFLMCQTRFFYDDSSYLKFFLNDNFLVKDQHFHFNIIFDSILSFVYSHVAILSQASIGIYPNVGSY